MTDRSLRIVRRSSASLPTTVAQRGVRTRSLRSGAEPPTSQVSFGRLARPASGSFSRFPKSPIRPKRKVCLDVTSSYLEPRYSQNSPSEIAEPERRGRPPRSAATGRSRRGEIAGRAEASRGRARLDCRRRRGGRVEAVVERGRLMNVLDRFRLDGQVALVTGGSRGLGRVMAEALASAGASVALTAPRRGSAAEVARRGRRARRAARRSGVGADVTPAGRRRGDGRADARRLRPARHPGQQRRDQHPRARSSSSARTTGTR